MVAGSTSLCPGKWPILYGNLCKNSNQCEWHFLWNRYDFLLCSFGIYFSDISKVEIEIWIDFIKLVIWGLHMHRTIIIIIIIFLVSAGGTQWCWLVNNNRCFLDDKTLQYAKSCHEFKSFRTYISFMSRHLIYLSLGYSKEIASSAASTKSIRNGSYG